MHSTTANRGPVEGRRWHPPAPDMKLLRPEFFRRYDVSTLFYIFFQFPRIPHPFFAGR
jgi:CCR4-NOT transcription complex subunit 3